MMDPATQAIARFIGLFELAVEEFRLRQDYLEFRLKRPAPEDAEPPFIVDVRLTAPYEIGRYDPGLAYEPAAPALPPVPPATIAAQVYHLSTALPDWGPDMPDPLFPVPSPQAIFVPGSFLLLPPGSVVSVTVQVAVLSDNDVFTNGLEAVFVDPDVLQKTLGAAASLAEKLTGFDAPDLPADGDWIGLAEAVLVQFETAPGNESGAEITTLRGDEAEGVFVNGLTVDEAPDWTELLPRHLQPDDPEADDVVEGAALPGSAADGEAYAYTSEGIGQTGTLRTPDHDFSRDFQDETPNVHTLDPGHEIVAGGNKAINEVVLGSQWIDAPVIVVRGDVAKFDAISQVNVLVEHDRVDGIATGQQSAGYNIAEIVTESSADPDAPPPDDDTLPGAWQVVRIEADLLQVNWIKQVTFVTDYDRAEVTFSGQATFLGLGENEIVNSTVLNEFGYGFDLIFVAGNMVDATIVSQKNVLHDSDDVQTHPAATDVAAAPADPAIPAEASTEGPTEDALEPVDAGPLPAEDVADTAIAAESTAEPGAAPTTDAPEPALSLADNLLLNQASIKTTGVDTFAEMTEKFAAAAESLAEGAETIAREVAQDALFAGREALRVLQIDGDLAKVNIFEQTNIVGDADQIRLEMQALRDSFEAEMKLIAGSNALINLATAAEYGVDSQIMAAGRVYDDAFIHQAELFDTDAVPNGVAVAGLANEAIAAFLSDDMLKVMEVTDDIVPISNHETASQLDVMQTALT